jgi:hypothetical protein
MNPKHSQAKKFERKTKISFFCKCIFCLSFLIFNSNVSFGNSISNDSLFSPLLKILSSPKDSTLVQDSVILRNIFVTGNKKTKTSVVIRESGLKVGMRIARKDLIEKLIRSRLFVMNTNLFNDAEVNIQEWSENLDQVDIKINVDERWYIWPVPLFELADRNFNVWWVQQNRKLDRINYGFRVDHKNLTGNWDPLSITLLNGYTRRIALDYYYPYLNKSKTIGVTLSYFYAENREVGFQVKENILEFFRKEENLNLIRQRSFVELNFRPGVIQRHNLRLEWQLNSTSDTVARFLNPNFFQKNQNRQKFFLVHYDFIYDDRDIKPYPMHGWHLNFSVNKMGILPSDDINAFSLIGRAANFMKFDDRNSFEWMAKSQIQLLPYPIPFQNMPNIGSEPDYLFGYEYFLMQARNYALIKTGYRFKAFDFSMNFGRLIPFKALRVIPFKIYLKWNMGAGYLDNPDFGFGNSLANRWIFGGGPGVDIVAFYGLTGKFEFSRNSLGQSGLFLHYKMNL